MKIISSIPSFRFKTAAHLYADGTVKVRIAKPNQPSENLTFEEFQNKYQEEMGSTWYADFATFYLNCFKEFKGARSCTLHNRLRAVHLVS